MEYKRLGYALLVCALVAWVGDVAAAPFKSAEIITRDTYKYGAAEARIRAAEGSGFITALFFWRPGSEVDDDFWQEQDFEIFGKNGRYQTQIMTPGRTQHVVNLPLSAPAYDHYFTYRMEWTPDYLAFYVDGELVRMETDPVEYQKHLDPDLAEPAEVRLSLWGMDEPWSGAFDEDAVPAAAFFDYCAVYAYTPGAGPAGSDFTQLWRDDFNTLNTSRWWFANWGWDVSTDYVPQNAAAIDGKLVLAMTTQNATGIFPSVIPANNPPLPPAPKVLPHIIDPEFVEPLAVPGRLEAEVVSDFFDTTPGNQGDSECSLTDIDAQFTSDSEGGYCNVGWTDVDEWLEYPIFVEDPGYYDLVVRAATPGEEVYVQVAIDGVDVSGARHVPSTDWQDFSDLLVPVELESGEHTIRLSVVAGLVNLNYIDVLAGSTPPPPPPGAIPDPSLVQPFDVPARLEAEVVSDYFDTTPGNVGDAECSVTDIDAQLTSDSQGGHCNVGWSEAGEWLEYPINVVHEGTYELGLRVATIGEEVYVSTDVDGVDVSGALYVPARTGWQDFTDLTVPVDLDAGEHTIRVHFVAGPANLNYIDVLNTFTLPEPPPPPVCDVPVTTYQAESMSATTGGVQGNLYNLWSDGTLSGGHDFEGGDAVVSVIAQGQSAQGVWPHMVVSVGNTVIGDVFVDSSSLESYEFYADTPASSQTITVEFDNDYYDAGVADRNLLIDAILVDDCP